MTDIDAAEASPEDVTFALTWLAAEDGGLTGALEARNISQHPVRLSGKPRLIPLDSDGQPLDAMAIATLEMRMPGYAELRPGESARSNIGWAGWDGPAAGGIVRVEWPGGQADVPVSGPRQPAGTGPATNLWSSWFDRVES